MVPLFAVMEAVAPTVPVVVTTGKWERRPSGDDMARVYPDSAQRKNLSGRVILSCTVTSEGSLANCTSSDEEPAGEGFGEAALKMAPLFKMKPLTRDGKPVEGGTVRIPLCFSLRGGFDQLSVESVRAQACYGQAAQLAEHSPAAPGAWKAAAYWHFQLMKQVASGGGRPSE